MILSHGMGASSYVPDAVLGAAQDEVDHGLVAFLQCYARDPFQWEIMMVFAQEDPAWFTPSQVARIMSKPNAAVAEKLRTLASGKLVEERILVTGPRYRLVQSDQLRSRVGRLATALRHGDLAM